MTTASLIPASSSPALDEVLRQAVARGDVAGVVAIATDGRQDLYRGTFGLADIASGRSLRTDDLFRIASMTKPVTSIAAMQLIEQGRFSLDDPVARHLPAFADLQVFESFDRATGAYTLRPARRAATIRDLLTHTSGLGTHFTDPFVRDFRPLAGETYAVGPLVFDPGERWLYSTSLTWLGRLIEQISDNPLEDYFQENIFRPLGMSDTSYFVPDRELGRLVTVNRRLADGTLAPHPDQPPTSNFTPSGSGGLVSTAPDYVRFLRMLLNHGVLDGARIVAADTVALMAQNHIGPLGVGAIRTALPEYSADFSFIADGRDKWGLGFLITSDAVPGKRSAGSLSWGGINNTFFWIDPARGVAGVILMQLLPFADLKALDVYDGFERGVYRIADGLKIQR
jgi:methyl acetate hydrolase